MLLLVFASLWAFVAEDEVNLDNKSQTGLVDCTKKKTNLCPRASKVRTKHNNPWSLVRKLLAARLEAILEQLDVTTTAIAALLVLDLVLNDKRLVRKLDGLVEGGRDSVMRRHALRN